MTKISSLALLSKLLINNSYCIMVDCKCAIGVKKKLPGVRLYTIMTKNTLDELNKI